MIKRFAAIALVCAAVPGVATADFDLAASQTGTSGPVTITMSDATPDAVATGVDLTLAFMPTGGAAGTLKTTGPVTGTPFTAITGPTNPAFGAPGFTAFSLMTGATSGSPSAGILNFSLDTSMVTTAGDFMVFAVTDATHSGGVLTGLSAWNDVNAFNGATSGITGIGLGPFTSANGIKLGTITAVPEPSSFVLLGLVGAIIGVRRTSLVSRLKAFFQR